MSQPTPKAVDPIINRANIGLDQMLGNAVRADNRTKSALVRSQRIFFALMSSGLVGLVVYYGFEVFRLRQQYRLAIKTIDDAIAAGDYTGPSGLRTVVAYAWGRMGALLMGFPSWHASSALVIMIYEKQWASIMQRSGGIGKWLQCVYKISQESSNLDVKGILCLALNCTRGPEFGCPTAQICSSGNSDVVECLPKCDPTAFVQDNTGAAVGISAAQGGSTGLAAGITIGASLGGPVGAAIGAAVGATVMAAISSQAAITQSQTLRQACLNARTHCVIPANAPPCGGCRRSGFLGLSVSCD